MLRGQFIISKNEIHFERSIRHDFADYKIYSTRDVEITINLSSEIIVLGNLYDFRNPRYSNQEIVDRLIIDKGLETFFEELSYLSGSYLILLKCDGELILVPDMACVKGCYIDMRDSEILILSSSVTLISKVKVVEKNRTCKELSRFYACPQYLARSVDVGNFTAYEGIVRMKANHFLNFKKRTFERFFPRSPAKISDVDLAAEVSSGVLKGIIESIAHRNRILLPVTGGWDSRLLMASTCNIKNEVIYYLLKHTTIPQLRQDLITSRKLFDKLKLPFQLIEYSEKISEEDSKMAEHHIDRPDIKSLGYIFNAWRKLFPHCINVNGNLSEIARNEWGLLKELSGNVLAHLAKYPKQPFCVSFYDSWLTESKEKFEGMGYQTLDMFYWEEVMANRISKAYSQTGLGIQMVSPFNCRFLINQMLSVNPIYRSKQDNILYKKMINNLWPELLLIPVNPGFRKTVIKWMQKIRIYDKYRQIMLTRSI
jgi:hypothetical protein